MELINKNERILLIPITAFLLFSWAFVDYMTSGLENPLTYFLTSLLLLILTLKNSHNYYKYIFYTFSIISIK